MKISIVLAAAFTGASLFVNVNLADAQRVGASSYDFVLVQPGARSAQATDLKPSPDPSTVDLGFFYAQEFAARNRPLASLDQTAQTMVDFMNAALLRSGVPLTMRISFAANFDESLDGIDTRTAHSRLGQRAAELRDTLLTDYGIDAVVLIKATDDVDDLFGIATLGTEESLSSNTTVPHAVVCLGAAQTSGLECFGRGGIFAHEVGHLFGAGHQRNAPVGGTGGAFEFSYASECGGGTIVYSPVSAAQEIYSTPDISADGEPCGIDASTGADGIDNAHTLDLTRSLMADLRSTMPILGSVFFDSPLEYSVSEGDPPVTVVLRRTGDISESARVTLAVVTPADGAADVTINPTDVDFGPGLESVAVEIAIVDDAVVEPDRSLQIGIRKALRLDADAQAVLLSITDNDEGPPPNPRPSPPSRGSGGGIVGCLTLLLLSITVIRRRGACSVAAVTATR